MNTEDISAVDAHIDAHEEKIAGVEIPNLCVLYEGARPALAFVKAILFFKPKWQKVIGDLMASLDAECSKAE